VCSSDLTDNNICLIETISPGFSSRDIQYFVQDKGFNIYLVSSAGKKIWKKSVTSKILSTIYVIDYFKNGNHQLLFNTAERIYLLDKNGKQVKGFPVKLKYRATNGLALADFDNDKNYRYYLAYSNNDFVSLSKDGRKVEGWKFGKTKNTVALTAQCFKFQNSDYILFSDSDNIYLLNRKGIQTLHLKEPFSKSVNNTLFVEEKSTSFRIITTDNSGTICYINPDGQIEKYTLGTFSVNHYFEAIDIDGTYEFLFADNTNICAYKPDKKKIFSINLTSILNQKPVYLRSKNNELVIASISKANNTLSVFRNSKELVKGFPIHGNFPMKVLSLSDITYSFSVLTGDSDKFMNYIFQ
jgi:hypothetical protein